MIIYTSGTTGKPKGTVHTHGSIEAMCEAMQTTWGWTENDHILNILPLHHVHGIMNIMNTSLWSGAQCTFQPKFNAEEVWKALLYEGPQDEDKLNLFMAVPTVYNKLIEYYDKNGMEGRSSEI